MTEVVRQLLVRDDIDVDSKDNDGQTPLIMAVKDHHWKIIKLLLPRHNFDMKLGRMDIGKNTLQWLATKVLFG